MEKLAGAYQIPFPPQKMMFLLAYKTTCYLRYVLSTIRLTIPVTYIFIANH